MAQRVEDDETVGAAAVLIGRVSESAWLLKSAEMGCGGGGVGSCWEDFICERGGGRREAHPNLITKKVVLQYLI